jgi:very-short-patch-repair endonuclease
VAPEHNRQKLKKMKPSKINHFGYNSYLQPFANNLRKDMTKAEACLWKYALKAGAMKGYQFRRQRPVLHFIADFMCMPLKLIIEADGFTHQFAETSEKDAKRDKDLIEAGFTILRFQDDEILKDINNVIRAIEAKIEEIEADMDVKPRGERVSKRKNLLSGEIPPPTPASGGQQLSSFAQNRNLNSEQSY